MSTVRQALIALTATGKQYSLGKMIRRLVVGAAASARNPDKFGREIDGIAEMAQRHVKEVIS